ncbi:MAG TPA: fasciclin domain-containing protein [Paludibacter sp.]|nr:fasciclin domain-containing protein [Paludibacter sp.]
MKSQSINRFRFVYILLGCLFLVSFQGCIIDSDKVGDSFYTFKGNTVGSFLEKHPETYSEFWRAVKKADLEDLLKTYSAYTCFAPNDSAMYNYYKDQGVSSLDELPAEKLKYMVYSHLIPDKIYKSIDLIAGALSFTNMNSRYLVVGFKAFNGTLNIVINTNSMVLDKGNEVQNGVVYTLNKVVTPSTSAIPTIIGGDERISLFSEALNKTGVSDSLQGLRDENYVPEVNPLSIDGKTICRSPKTRKIGFTVFIESNEVFHAHGIDNLEDLKRYAASVYDKVYPEDAGISDITDRRNSLNRFVSYHIIDKTVNYNNFFYRCNMAADVTLYEFMETLCPNTMFKVSNETSGVVINSDVARGVTGVTVLPMDENRLEGQDTENGVYHLIDNVLVYDQKVITMLLNTRIRMDAASLHPELMTNGIRYEKGDNPSGVTGAANFYKFPNGYLKNVKVISSNTRLYYLQGQKSSSSWVNYQADEMMAQGEFDFIMRLPPVPAGTYEVRFGYTANTHRGVLQFYVDDDNGDLIPRGIPLNMKRAADEPAIGWLSDASTLDNGVEMDKMLRNRGYMKGGTSYMAGTISARSWKEAMRRIVCTETWNHDGPHYLRFKSVSGDNLDQFMIDYFELVPTNVYNNPNGQPEDRL